MTAFKPYNVFSYTFSRAGISWTTGARNLAEAKEKFARATVQHPRDFTPGDVWTVSRDFPGRPKLDLPAYRIPSYNR